MSALTCLKTTSKPRVFTAFSGRIRESAIHKKEKKGVRNFFKLSESQWEWGPFFLDRRVLPEGSSSWVKGKSGRSLLSISEVMAKKAFRKETQLLFQFHREGEGIQPLMATTILSTAKLSAEWVFESQLRAVWIRCFMAKSSFFTAMKWTISTCLSSPVSYLSSSHLRVSLVTFLRRMWSNFANLRENAFAAFWEKGANDNFHFLKRFRFCLPRAEEVDPDQARNTVQGTLSQGTIFFLITKPLHHVRKKRLFSH